MMSTTEFNPNPKNSPLEFPQGEKIYVVTKITTQIRIRHNDNSMAQPISNDKIGLLGMLPVFSSMDAALAYCGDPDLILTLTAK